MERMEINLGIMTKDQLKKFIVELEEENKKLNEFKTKREESMFYFKAQMERAEPKTAREAEDLQRAKDIFEKLYREELSCLKEENKKMKFDIEARKEMKKAREEKIRFLEECLDNKERANEKLREKLNKAGLEEYGFFNEY